MEEYAVDIRVQPTATAEPFESVTGKTWGVRGGIRFPQYIFPKNIRWSWERTPEDKTKRGHRWNATSDNVFARDDNPNH